MKTSESITSQVCSVTAIVTAYNRIQQTLLTLQKILDCKPRPDEIIVHVDANQKHCAAAINQSYPGLKTILSRDREGPGGARNKLIAAAKNELVASFDDDSYPIDTDYFARVIFVFEKYPAASVLCAAVYHRNQAIDLDSDVAAWVSDFAGGGCVYRRTSFLSTGGYVPLPVAYGMEEADLALRLHERGSRIFRTQWLRVFHDTDLKRHADAEVTAGSIMNLALLTYLRYPVLLWPVGLAQCCNRVLWLSRHARWRGILTGLISIPRHLWLYRSHRKTVSLEALKSYLHLRHSPENVIATQLAVPERH